MTQETLFELPEQPVPQVRERGCGKARINSPQRQQVEARVAALDDLVPLDHQVRSIWAYVNELDLSSAYQSIFSVEGHVGRPATDPKLLTALWIYATVDGVGSARSLERHTENHLIYQWLCGGVKVNHHTLSDFRSQYGALFDDLLAQTVATMATEGLLVMETVSHDGMRVRASAGTSSFRRKQTLKDNLEAVTKHVQTLKEELDSDPTAGSRRQNAMKERVAKEKQERLKQALEQFEELEAQKKRKSKDPESARASSTDPDARKMKMADGGFRPAYNVQFSVDTETMAIVNYDAINRGSDQGLLIPVIEGLAARYGIVPQNILVDAGYCAKNQLIELSTSDHNCDVYMPLHKGLENQKVPALIDLKARMSSDKGKELYKLRPASVECVNALTRIRGLTKFLVRGLAKVKATVGLHAITHNIMRHIALRKEVAMAA